VLEYVLSNWDNISLVITTIMALFIQSPLDRSK
jgi:hypothetical protein